MTNVFYGSLPILIICAISLTIGAIEYFNWKKEHK